MNTVVNMGFRSSRFKGDNEWRSGTIWKCGHPRLNDLKVIVCKDETPIVVVPKVGQFHAPTFREQGFRNVKETGKSVTLTNVQMQEMMKAEQVAVKGRIRDKISEAVASWEPNGESVPYDALFYEIQSLRAIRKVEEEILLITDRTRVKREKERMVKA